MRILSEYQRETRSKWAVGLACFSLIGSIALALGIHKGIPPTTYLFLGLFWGMMIPTFLLGYSGLKCRSKEARFYAITALVFASLTTVCFVPFAINSLRTGPAKIALKQIEEAIGPACFGEIISGTAEYKPGAEDISIIAFNVTDGSGFYPFTNNWIPKKFWPKTIGDVELVLCMGDQYEDKIQGCGYTEGITMIRYQYKRDVRLVSIWNGEVIIEGEIEGSLPDECPEVTNKSGSIKGSKPGVDEVDRWLERALGQ